MGIWYRLIALVREDFGNLFLASNLRLKKEACLRFLLYLSFLVFSVLAFWPVFHKGDGASSGPHYQNKGFESPPVRPSPSENEGSPDPLQENRVGPYEQFGETTDI